MLSRAIHLARAAPPSARTVRPRYLMAWLRGLLLLEVVLLVLVVTSFLLLLVRHLLLPSFRQSDFAARKVWADSGTSRARQREREREGGSQSNTVSGDFLTLFFWDWPLVVG